ncbi:phasyl DNA replicon protein arp [Chitinibacter bivalviorum]|uniref:Phasyl DNA replicon protein arp n=1 Tax=Chitinibacter bivalviorum TaxID=2739434 RepID=A0A7H9BH97_9NEIS|nr:phasyl DNA replicon protein arp [Chitinibacter bivalviorum]QLG87626.1 phasyl DNA replicon protein arp [Chitinibacter bivalviorum]
MTFIVAENKSAPIDGALPCLNRNNSTGMADAPHLNDISIAELEGHNQLSTAHKKAAAALGWNVEALIKEHGIKHIGFLTLTFPDDVKCFKEAQRRFNSLVTHVLGERYQARIRVLERCKSGRIHYHVLVVLRADIQSGFNFDEVVRKNYQSACTALKSEWRFWRGRAKKYGFGRVELMPIKSSTEAVAKYVSKYIEKAVAARSPEDKGARLVEYSSNARMASTKFSFVSAGSAQWRKKLAHFAQLVEKNTKRICRNISHFTQILGNKWAFNCRSFILALTIVSSPANNENAINYNRQDGGFFTPKPLSKLPYGAVWARYFASVRNTNPYFRERTMQNLCTVAHLIGDEKCHVFGLKNSAKLSARRFNVLNLGSNRPALYR